MALDQETEFGIVKTRVDVDLKVAFEAACRSQDRSASQVLRDMMRDYVRKHAQADLLEQRQPARRRR